MLLLVLAAVLVKVGLLQTVQGDTLRSAASRAVDARPHAAGAAGHDLRPQRRRAGAVGAGQHGRRQPQQVEDPVGTAELFAQTLGLDAAPRDELEAAMAAQDRGFVYVARQVDDDKAGAARRRSTSPA